MEVGNKFIFPSVDKDDHVLIYGSCLFSALGFVVERSRETHESWMVGCMYNVGNHMISFEVPPTMLKFDATYEDAFPVYTSCLTVSGTARAVTLEEPKRMKELQTLPPNTIELQTRASCVLGLSCDKTMEIAEQLYLGGYISYPRTDTNSFPSEFDLITIPQGLKEHPS
ncbi:putative DNA topoisomerase [Helianthus annuus]|nr:putative DNA topoisomerase [Helianthus annuus]